MRALLFLAIACSTEADPLERNGETGVPDTDTDDSGDTGGTPAECDSLAELPLKADYLSGFTGAEDFAFDAEGYLVSIDENGNLVGINQGGETRVIVAGATTYGAGTRFLPNGDLVFCDVTNGSLIRVEMATGATSVVLSGLEYPNGLDVGLDGFVYVSEQSGGRVRRVDPETGEYTVIVEGLYQPNGVTFAPGYQTLYVGSFGAGVVWAADRIADTTWTEPRIVATTPEAPGVPPDWCDSHPAGDECPTYYGYGLGVCADDGSGDLDCADATDTAACDGLAIGGACTTSRFGEPLESRCETGTFGLFCPRTSAEATEACEGLGEGAACMMGSKPGTCAMSFEGVNACWNYEDYYAAIAEGCADHLEGADCETHDDVYPSVGSCTDGSAWGMPGLICLAPGAYSENGGLDAINTDECGNLYVSEYIEGVVWRFATEGAEAEKVSQLRSSWIPNMHWGNGRGGWDTQTLYVMDRDRKGVFAVPVGVGGHGDAYEPP
ncbi:hypothetical protein LBMAG42_22680 [Deltaproteobacteria bacterium]|nr:hypothetical protein LBMAG42_22680 [Deltaproteobacteria bacterium]